MPVIDVPFLNPYQLLLAKLHIIGYITCSPPALRASTFQLKALSPKNNYYAQKARSATWSIPNLFGSKPRWENYDKLTIANVLANSKTGQHNGLSN